ncbi:MAG: hypothetical protein JOZ65_27585, partial [Chloroflexi bacterium]|nr:hypothetical protein [Chloroflexota bacterium]
MIHDTEALGGPDVLNGGIAAAEARTAGIDALVAGVATHLTYPVALVALGAYGRRQVTPWSEVELLVLHRGGLSTAEATQSVCYPLWEQAIHVEP